MEPEKKFCTNDENIWLILPITQNRRAPEVYFEFRKISFQSVSISFILNKFVSPKGTTDKSLIENLKSNCYGFYAPPFTLCPGGIGTSY